MWKYKTTEYFFYFSYVTCCKLMNVRKLRQKSIFPSRIVVIVTPENKQFAREMTTALAEIKHFEFPNKTL